MSKRSCATLHRAHSRARPPPPTRSRGFRDGHVNAELATPCRQTGWEVPAKNNTSATNDQKRNPQRSPDPRRQRQQPEHEKRPINPRINRNRKARQKQTEAAQTTMPTSRPKTSAEYALYAAKKIDDFTDYDKAREWWDSDDERDLRDKSWKSRSRRTLSRQQNRRQISGIDHGPVWRDCGRNGICSPCRDSAPVVRPDGIRREICDLFEQLALQVRARGIEHFSADAIPSSGGNFTSARR